MYPYSSIIITLSRSTISDRKGGFKKILSEWRSSNGENSLWYYRLSNRPKIPVDQIEYVYWVINNRIRYRSKLADIISDRAIQFTERTKPMYAKNWVVLFDFEYIPKNQQIPLKGFQGFRYYKYD